MKTSLAKMFNTIESFVVQHTLLEDFSVVPITDYVAKNWKYSVVWIDLQATTISFSKGVASVNMPIYIMDRVERDFSNYVSVVSSSTLSFGDLITYFNDKYCDLGFDCDLAASLTTVGFEFDDLVAGVKGNVIFKTPESFNESEIPT